MNNPMFGGIKIQYQSDPDFANEVMEHPVWQMQPDTIIQYFCWNTALINCFNHYHKNILKDDKYIDIKDMNDAMIANRGYKYLADITLGVEKAMQLCYRHEAESLSNVQDSILDIKEQIHSYTGNIDISVPNEYYVIVTPFKDTGHYSWLTSISGILAHYIDSYDAILKTTDKWLEIIKIIFN